MPLRPPVGRGQRRPSLPGEGLLLAPPISAHPRLSPQSWREDASSYAAERCLGPARKLSRREALDSDFRWMWETACPFRVCCCLILREGYAWHRPGGLANRRLLAAKLLAALWGISQCNGFWVFPGVASEDKRGCLSWFSSMETGPLAPRKMSISNPRNSVRQGSGSMRLFLQSFWWVSHSWNSSSHSVFSITNCSHFYYWSGGLMAQKCAQYNNSI